MSSLVFNNLTLGYQRHPAVHHLNLEIKRGELVAIIGPNGAGKTTLLKGICGLIEPLEGAIELGGIDRRSIAYMPQQREMDLAFPIVVRDVVGGAIGRGPGLFATRQQDTINRVDAALERVEMLSYADQLVGTLSGGQMQRIMFARALVQESPLMLLDEPFAALDGNTIKVLVDVLHDLQKQGTTTLAVIHDMRVVKANFPRTLLLARELIAYDNTRTVFTPENLLAAQHMQESFDELAQVCHFETRESAS